MDSLFAKGTGLYVGDGASPEMFTLVASVKGISGPDFKVKVIDDTTHDTAGNYMSKQAVLIDPGSVKFSINYNPSDPTHAPSTGLFSYMDGLETRSWQIRFPPSDILSTQMSFRGFVEQHPFKFPVADIMEADISIGLRGGVTFGTFTP